MGKCKCGPLRAQHGCALQHSRRERVRQSGEEGYKRAALGQRMLAAQGHVRQRGRARRAVHRAVRQRSQAMGVYSLVCWQRASQRLQQRVCSRGRGFRF